MTGVAGLRSGTWQSGAASAGNTVAADLRAIESDLKGTGKGTTLDPIARLLGVTTAALKANLKSGKTLAAIAGSHGKPAADVESALTQTIQTHLDAAVKGGKLSQSAAAALLQPIRARIDGLVTGRAPRAPIHLRASAAAGMSLLDAMAANKAANGSSSSPTLTDLLTQHDAGSTSTGAFSGGLADYLA